MKYRVAMWAGVGFFVAAFWAVYLFPTSINTIANQPAVWGLARLSCPVVFASSYFRFGISIYWVLLANAVTYALIGSILETLRHQLHPAA